MTLLGRSRWCQTAAVSIALAVTGAGAAPAMGEGSAAQPSSDDSASRQLAMAAQHPTAVVVAFNQRACDIAFAEDQFLTFKGARALSMMHVAMHDALNAVVPFYQPYAFARREALANPVVAAAQAAHDVLLSQYPGQQAALDQELDAWLSNVPDGWGRRRGIALGQSAALAILSRRDGDGWDAPGTYEFRAGAGEYQTTPPWNGFVLQPGFRDAQPFGLKAPDQFRPPPPPSLTRGAYAAAFDEVTAYGRADSVVRSPDQTGYAVWWMEFAEGSMNRLARDLIVSRPTHLWRAARTLALLNMSLFDTYVAVWDAKYAYNHWRPYTAIRAAGDDGNDATAPDASWEPLRTTPPFPDYPSAHGAVCNASLGILARTFGDRTSFTMTSATAPPGMPARSFARFSDAGAECADSRVMLGYHFRYATDRGVTLGRRVARYLETSLLRPFGSPK